MQKRQRFKDCGICGGPRFSGMFCRRCGTLLCPRCWRGHGQRCPKPGRRARQLRERAAEAARMSQR
jgi:recombinational DNA repair protein (RecF pathway)